MLYIKFFDPILCGNYFTIFLIHKCTQKHLPIRFGVNFTLKNNMGYINK